MTKKEHITEAARALANLNTFGSVAFILEGGQVYGPNATASRIIAMCKEEMQRQLKIYNKHVEAAEE